MYLEHSRYCSFFHSFLFIHSFNTYSRYAYGLPRWLSGKESAHNEGDLGLIPGLGRSPGEGNGNSLRPHGLWPARLLCPWDSPGKHPGVSCHALLQGIFPTQGPNSCLLSLQHWQVGSSPSLITDQHGKYNNKENFKFCENYQSMTET